MTPQDSEAIEKAAVLINGLHESLGELVELFAAIRDRNRLPLSLPVLQQELAAEQEYRAADEAMRRADQHARNFLKGIGGAP